MAGVVLGRQRRLTEKLGEWPAQQGGKPIAQRLRRRGVSVDCAAQVLKGDVDLLGGPAKRPALVYQGLPRWLYAKAGHGCAPGDISLERLFAIDYCEGVALARLVPNERNRGCKASVRPRYPTFIP